MRTCRNSRPAAGSQRVNDRVAGYLWQADFPYPVALTPAARSRCVGVPPGVLGQDDAGRLGDVLTVFRLAARGQGGGAPEVRFAVHVRDDNRARIPPLVRPKAVFGAFPPLLRPRGGRRCWPGARRRCRRTWRRRGGGCGRRRSGPPWTAWRGTSPGRRGGWGTPSGWPW